MTNQIDYNMGMDNFCIKCKKLIPKIDKQGRKLSNKVYMKKKYCSRTCADIYRKEKKLGWYGVNWSQD